MLYVIFCYMLYYVICLTKASCIASVILVIISDSNCANNCFAYKVSYLHEKIAG